MRLTIVFDDGINVVGKNEEGTLFTKSADSRFMPIATYTILRDESGNEIMSDYTPLDTGDIFS